jgi:ribosomal protein S18 acetylase RimI-like enzyme
VEIERAEARESLAAANDLLAEYLSWVLAATREAGLDPETLRAHYYGDNTLPGAFAAPDGCLMIARVEGEPVGLVGYDRADAETCEMKRLYVTEEARGQGVAHALCTRLLEEAHAAGYRAMRLETRAFMGEAIALYTLLGFADSEAFHPIPESFRAQTRFMRKELDS